LTIQIVCPLESTAETQPKLHPALLRLSAMISHYFTGPATFLLTIQHCLQCGFNHFKLCAHFLQACSERFDLPLLAREGRFLFLGLAMLFDELIKQGRGGRAEILTAREKSSANSRVTASVPDSSNTRIIAGCECEKDLA
jgi:hypothetical protein